MGWTDVAQAVIARRVELGMKTRQRLAETTGLSVKTLGEIERSVRTSYDPATLAAVEQALRWPVGTITAMASGRPPGALRPHDASDDPDPLEAKLERLQLLAEGLNPSDLRQLSANIQTQIDWAFERAGRPEPTPEEREQTERLQRAANAHNRALREHRAGGAPALDSQRAGKQRS
jgi:transcriptional regulator with XRE-family HTH domain